MNCVSRLISLIALICIVPLFGDSERVTAGSHDEHCKDWIACLGIAQTDKGKFCESMIEFSNQIDVGWDFLEKLKREYGLGLSVGEHRLLFHWGFNNDPKNSNPLKEKMKKCGLSPEKKDSLIRYLREQQKQRNGRMIIQVEAITGAAWQSRALATILYNVHILGDYDTELVEPLLDPKEVNSDLMQKGILRMEFKTGTEELLEALDNAERSGESDKQKAKNIINTLKANLPGLLSKQWHGSFPSGIRLAGQEAKNAK